MAVSLVQSVTKTSPTSPSSQTVTFGSGVTSGNRVIVMVAWDLAYSALNTVSGLGATWTQKARHNDASGANSVYIDIWEGVGVTTGTVVTVTFAGNGSCVISASEVSGVVSTGAAVTADGNSTASATPSVTLASGDLALAMVTRNGNVVSGETAADTGSWTAIISPFYEGGALAYSIDSASTVSTGPVVHGWTSTSGFWAAAAIPLHVSAPAGPPPRRQIRSFQAVQRASVR